LIALSVLVILSFVHWASRPSTVDWRRDPQVSLLAEANCTLAERIFALSANAASTRQVARFCNEHDLTSLRDPQILFLIRLSAHTGGIPYAIHDATRKALSYVAKYPDFQQFTPHEADLFVRAILDHFNGTMIERYHKALKHAVRLGAAAFYELHKSRSIPSDAYGIMTNKHLDPVEEASFIRLLDNFFTWDAHGELGASFSHPGEIYDDADLYYAAIFDTKSWFGLNCTRGLAPVYVEVKPDEWEWRHQYKEYHPWPCHDEWLKSRNTTRLFVTLWNNTVNDLEDRHQVTRRFVTDPAFREQYLHKVSEDARMIGVYPQVPETIQEYAEFVIAHGEHPDHLYLAVNAWFEEALGSKGLVAGNCHGISLARIQVSRSLGIPSFYFVTAMHSIHLPAKWRGCLHAEPGWMTTSNLSRRLRAQYADVLAYEGAIFCPLFATKTYLEDLRVQASHLSVLINGEEHYLYGA
jgi:hypothetical protein